MGVKRPILPRSNLCGDSKRRYYNYNYELLVYATSTRYQYKLVRFATNKCLPYRQSVVLTSTSCKYELPALTTCIVYHCKFSVQNT